MGRAPPARDEPCRLLDRKPVPGDLTSSDPRSKEATRPKLSEEQTTCFRHSPALRHGRPRNSSGRRPAGSPPAPRRCLRRLDISDEGHRELAFMCAQIRNRFGAQIDHARRTAKPEELARSSRTFSASSRPRWTRRAARRRPRCARSRSGLGASRAGRPRPFAAAPPHLNFGA